MDIVEKTIVSPCDLFNRNAHRLAYKISYLSSDIKINTLDKPPVNAKSILGLLSASIRNGMLVRIACYNEKEELAKQDLNIAINILNELAVQKNE